MKVLIAKRGGYCYGVKRALDIANAAAGQAEGPIYTLGPIIHNPGVVHKLSQAGVSSVDRVEDVLSGTVILRSHGVSPRIVAEAEARGLSIVDATCPYVKVAQENAAALREEGYIPIIVGEHEHPEVVALLAHAGKKALRRRERRRAGSGFPQGQERRRGGADDPGQRQSGGGGGEAGAGLPASLDP